MSVDEEIEFLSRVDIMPMSFFDEIISRYPDDLEKISLAFFECFSHLKTQVMTLKGTLVENHVTFTRNYLQGVTDKIVENNLTPGYIKNFFNQRLLIHNQHNKYLNHKKLWLAWLEFLIIMNIYKDNVIDDNNIEDIFNSHRLIFSTTENDWSVELSNIIKSDFRGLNEDSKIIVSTNSNPAVTIIHANYLTDIMREQAVPKSQLMIDDAQEYPLYGHKLVHLTAFQTDCIVEKSIEYRDYTALNEEELIIKLRTEYERLFS